MSASLVKRCTWLAQHGGEGGREVWWGSPASPLASTPPCIDYGADGGAHRLSFPFDPVYSPLNLDAFCFTLVFRSNNTQ